MMKVMFISNVREIHGQILQPLNKGIQPTRPSIMIFCKPHVQVLLKNVIVVGPSCEIFAKEPILKKK